MKLEQFKKLYQAVLDSGRNPGTVQLNPIDARILCGQYDLVWGWKEGKINHLYGMDIITCQMERGTAIFGKERPRRYPVPDDDYAAFVIRGDGTNDD